MIKARRWDFSADAQQYKLVSEAQRLRWAHLFDPYLAIHSSQIEPLPHQIVAVYERMLPRQPLRYLLADDPGAGKTIMAGLLIKELKIRGDVRRCLIVCPGSLVQQWQEELQEKFGLSFSQLAFQNDQLENPFLQNDWVIARMDKLARNEALLEHLRHTEWDCVICDEAHKMSASFFNKEIHYTRRYRLGQLLQSRTRHFLLMTATPHNGKEEEFQLFMALLDPDRFEGHFDAGVQSADVSDLMRRMVKEKLVKFDGRPLFPERIAQTVSYQLSPLEATLYEEVTNYVRDQFNLADRLENNGRRGTVGFALTVLQRRLASSTAAIAQSLSRRLDRLNQQLKGLNWSRFSAESPFADDEFDEDDWTAEEQERKEQELSDQATAALTVEELQKEIAVLQQLVVLAKEAKRHPDRKLIELSNLLHENEAIHTADGQFRKVIIFTEHRDTLFYLKKELEQFFGQEDAIVTIQGGMRSAERRAIETQFRENPAVKLLIATDAAGEGINLQRAHLMINYDLPWNPNRLEQRFGRIHRIGQTEVCRLWNLVASDTREGAVYETLLHKLDRERAALGDVVFDVLGQAINGKALRELLIEAIRYGERAEVREHLSRQLEGALDSDHLHQLLQKHALSEEVTAPFHWQKVRANLERVMAHRLQPILVAAFLREAFALEKWVYQSKGEGQWAIPIVPELLRQRHREVLPSYPLITFDKKQRAESHSAELLSLGHPLFEALIDVTLERYGALLSVGTVLIDENDPDQQPHLLLALAHSLFDGRETADGTPFLVARRDQFILLPLGTTATDQLIEAGSAPYLNYRPITPEEGALIAPLLPIAQRQLTDLESAESSSLTQLTRQQFASLQRERPIQIKKIKLAVKQRLTQEIAYWDGRANELRQQEKTGKKNAALNSKQAEARADGLHNRLEQRLAQLDKELAITTPPPAIVGGALIVPKGWLDLQNGRPASLFARETKRVESVAMRVVMEHERSLGRIPQDLSRFNLGYDIESADPQNSSLLFIEVKGRIAGSTSVTVTRNEIIAAFNSPDQWILALVSVPPEESAETPQFHYLSRPFKNNPDPHAVSVNYDWKKLIASSSSGSG